MAPYLSVPELPRLDSVDKNSSNRTSQSAGKRSEIFQDVKHGFKIRIMLKLHLESCLYRGFMEIIPILSVAAGS